jgi:cytochrome P450
MTVTQSLEGFDIHAAGAHDGAESLWARMRDGDGLYHSDRYGGFHVAARYEDVMAVLLKPAIYASGRGITLPPPDGVRSYHIPSEIDPPAHREYRALLGSLLTPKHARAMEPEIRALATGLIDRIPDGDSFDFVRAFARPLPILVTLSLMKCPLSDAETLERMVEDLHREVATGEPTGAPERLKAYSERVVADRKLTATDPAADIVSSIVLGTAFDRPLTPEEQMSMVRQVLVGGFDTVSIALATMMWWLARNPDEAERLRGNPAAIDLASEEIVRFASPSTYLRREVVEPTELGGTPLNKGDSVLIAFGAANRDPAKFDRPDEIVPDRKPNPHVGFGAGHHRCVGSFVAKAQLRIAFEEILARFFGFALDPEGDIEHSAGLGQGIMRLPVIFTRS